MDWELVLTKAVFGELCRRLAEEPSRATVCPAGLARLPDRHTALVATLDSGGSGRGDLHLVAVGAAWEQELAARLRATMRRPPADTPAVFLALGTGQAAGACAGEVLGWRGAEPLRAVRVIAESLPVARLDAGQAPPEFTADALEIWSRSIGALSAPVWRNLTGLKPALFGCGRSGSLLSGALVRSGVRAMTIIDGDRIELGNLGEMDLVYPGDTGKNKAEALAAALTSLPLPGSDVHPVAGSATSLSALLAAKDADLLITCVDNAAARLAVAMLAQLYLKPLLDVGTGVLETHPGARRMGLDVRLLLPGQCPACFGGLRLAEAAVGMRDADRMETDWRRQRAGSLRSLNMIGAGMALRLLEDFLAGEIRESTWLSLDYERGVPLVSAFKPPPASDCPVCALAGRGDAGLGEVPALLERLAA